MSAATQAMCTSFKVELLTATHDFTPSTGDTFKLALYGATASISGETTAYTTTGEVSGAGYTAGGVTLTTLTPTSVGTTGYVDFENVTLSTVTIAPSAGLIYNSSKSNRAVCVLDFGFPQTRVAQDLVITFPNPSADGAMVRIT